MRRLVLTVLAAVVLLVPGLPAHAELYSDGDAAQDVEAWSNSYCQGTDGPPEPDWLCPWTASSLASVAGGDIQRTNVRHQSGRVLFRIKERSIDAVGQRSHNVVIETNEGVRRSIRFTAPPGVLQPRSVIMRKPGGAQVACSGLWAGLDSTTDIATLIVPRRCLSYPRWVRVGVSTEGRWIACPQEMQDPELYECVNEDGRLILRNGRFVADDTHTDLYDTTPDLSPRIHRG